MTQKQVAQKKSKNANHPKPGSSIKVEPIRDLKAIKRIKRLYANHPRDLCLFTLGINSAYRANELLSLNVGQVDYLRPGDRLEIKQSKSGKYRAITVNTVTMTAIDAWLREHPDQRADAPLFISRKTGDALTVSALNTKIKDWCRRAGLRGNYGTHTMRKTWGYHQRITNERPLPLLMTAFGHKSQAQTLEYLCIQDEEIDELYGMEL